MAAQQKELSLDAGSHGDFTESVKHDLKANYYLKLAHTYKDSMFNEQYINHKNEK
jgi:hypothetical protein